MVKGLSAGRFSNAGNMARLAGGVPLLLLALAAWCVLLAGLSVTRHAGGENAFGIDLGFYWFICFFELFVLLTALLHIVGSGTRSLPLPVGSSAVTGLLAAVTALTCLATSTFNVARKASGTGNQLGKGLVTTFSGFLVLSVLNGLLILVLGNQPVNTGVVNTHNNGMHATEPGYTGTRAPVVNQPATATAVGSEV